jgi:hypothetical protein
MHKIDINDCTYENMVDPITLQDVKDIKESNRFVWTQNQKVYCVDIEGLFHYIQFGNTINPWAIDKATGHAEADDREAYLEMFDMSRVEGLITRIKSSYNKLSEKTFDVSKDDIPLRTKQRFAIENICPDMYITHVVDFFSETDIRFVIRILKYAVYSTYLQHKQLIETQTLDDNALLVSEILEQCFIGLTDECITILNGPNLEIISNILTEWSNLLENNVMVTLFDIFSDIISSIISL